MTENALSSLVFFVYITSSSLQFSELNILAFK